MQRPLRSCATTTSLIRTSAACFPIQTHPLQYSIYTALRACDDGSTLMSLQSQYTTQVNCQQSKLDSCELTFVLSLSVAEVDEWRYRVLCPLPLSLLLYSLSSAVFVYYYTLLVATEHEKWGIFYAQCGDVVLKTGKSRRHVASYRHHGNVTLMISHGAPCSIHVNVSWDHFMCNSHSYASQCVLCAISAA